MKTLPLLIFLAANALVGFESHAGGTGLGTAVDPKPPYAPGTKVHIKVSGPGMDQLQGAAYFRLLGDGATDFMQSAQILKSGSPAAFEWDIIAPRTGNTLTPKLVFDVTYKNGVQETLDADNTPAFSTLKFTGIKLDRDAPEVSNFKFTQTGSGQGKLEFDATDPSGVDSTGSLIQVGGWNIFSYHIGGESYATSFTHCKGSVPKYHCVSEATFPAQAKGSINFEIGIADTAGNRNDFEKSYDLTSIKNADTSKPSIAWPIRATVCSDRSIRMTFKMNGGGGALFQGFVGVWSSSLWDLAFNSGIAEQGEVTCNNGNCEATLSVPTLTGLGHGGLNAKAGSESSGSSAGGIRAGNNLRVSLDSINGEQTEYVLPAAVVEPLANPPSDGLCKLVEISPSSVHSVGTVSKDAAVPAK